MIASMSLTQSSLVLMLHPTVVVVAHVVVVVVDAADGAGGEGLGMSQHQLLPSHWLGRLLLQFAIFWHVTDQGSTSELLRCQHPTLLSLSQGMVIQVVRWWSFAQHSMLLLLKMVLLLVAALLLLSVLLLLLLLVLVLVIVVLLMVLLVVLLMVVVVMGGRAPTLHAVHIKQSTHISCRSESSNKSL